MWWFEYEKPHRLIYPRSLVGGAILKRIGGVALLEDFCPWG